MRDKLIKVLEDKSSIRIRVGPLKYIHMSYSPNLQKYSVMILHEVIIKDFDDKDECVDFVMKKLETIGIDNVRY